MQRKKLNFTLIELLVVIVIIIIIMGMLIPVISQVRKRAYVATCRENLSQFGKSIAMYRPDYEDKMPFWLSDLYGGYGLTKDILVCPQDYSAGEDGGRPGGPTDKFTPEDYGATSTGDNGLLDSYPETDDTQSAEDQYADTFYWQQRTNSDKIKFCSYMYEFTATELNQFGLEAAYDGPETWWHYKAWEFRTDKMDDGKEIQAYEFPVVRCVYHWGVMWGGKDFVQNTAMDGSTFTGPAWWRKGRYD